MMLPTPNTNQCIIYVKFSVGALFILSLCVTAAYCHFQPKPHKCTNFPSGILLAVGLPPVHLA